MKPALRVGLTGGIGSGKSTVCSFFEKLGAPVIDADVISHELVQPGGKTLSIIASTFGRNILTSNGALDRNKMRELVFSDEQKRQQLENIIHPLVYEEIDQRVSRVSKPYCIIAIPLLLETNGQAHVDRILLINTSSENQILRASQRDSTSKSSIEKIIATQMPAKSRLKAADDIIENNSSVVNLEEQIRELHLKYLEIADSWHFH